jgi:hypothetical protein
MKHLQGDKPSKGWIAFYLSWQVGFLIDLPPVLGHVFFSVLNKRVIIEHADELRFDY